jgi:UPF0755 protein
MTDPKDRPLPRMRRERPQRAPRSIKRRSVSNDMVRKPRSSRRGLAAGLVLLLVVVFAGIGAWYTLFRNESGLAPGRPVQVVVPAKSSSAQIASILAGSGAVPNALMFRVQARLEKGDGKLKPGTYELTTGMDYLDVIATLEEGPKAVYYTVAIPEGWTIGQIAKRVQAKTGIPATEFTKIATTQAQDPTLRAAYPFLKSNKTASLEGYLFPKTYQVKKGSTAMSVVEKMLTQFGTETAGLDLSFASSAGISEHGVVTIASIIEREASVPGDRPLVASVIYNRLSKKMRLQLDSTVMYVVGNKTLTLDDLKVASPYNTYVTTGLPPGPIASPGLIALQAAAAPTKSTYLYYIMDHKDGSQSFTNTYDEFLKLKAQAKKGLK